MFLFSDHTTVSIVKESLIYLPCFSLFVCSSDHQQYSDHMEY